MAPGATPPIVTVGGIASMLMPPTVALRALPAASRAVPATDWPAPLSSSFASAGQVATPERTSAQVKRTVTAPPYQPSALGARSGAPLIDGAVLSSITVTWSVPRLPARSLAWPSTGWPGVSRVTSWSGVTEVGSTPEPRSSSTAAKWTVVSARFQPAAFGAGLTRWVTVGAMLSYLRATALGA